ncbi:hypothetical protein BJ170DRAFT_421669 [Xylariales sp. AK1849]|nr:hypothetical protein BJ170DRAFT_421669 [Xylariales sp. AK1849]
MAPWNYKDFEVAYQDDCRERQRGGRFLLTFSEWLLSKRIQADNFFDRIKRRAISLEWKDDCFIGAAELCMRGYGKYFGSFGGLPPYAQRIKGIARKDAPRPWDVPMKRDRSAPPSVQSSPKRKSELRKRAKEKTKWYTTDTDGEEDAADPHTTPPIPSAKVIPSDDVVEPTRSIDSATECSECGEVNTDHTWHWRANVNQDGHEDSYYFCATPRCSTAISLSAVERSRKRREKTLKCHVCRRSMCNECGAIQWAFSHTRYHVVDTVMNTLKPDPGSAKYKRTVRRIGFRDLTMDDIYVPLKANAEDHTVIAAVREFDELMKMIDDTTYVGVNGVQKQLSDCGLGAEGVREVINQLKDQLRRVQLGQIDFHKDHQKTPSDYWFAVRNSELYDLTVWFATDWFGDIDFPADYEGFAWLEDFGPQFINYANLVAHEDRTGGDWERMIRDKEMRKWLVVAIIAQIIEKKIFNELLFGATKQQIRELEKQDVTFMNADGYERSIQRAGLTNLMLGQNRRQPEPVAPLFWEAVDELTAQTVKIFLPLINILCYYRNAPKWTDLWILYQNLRQIIAHAGYFAVSMRRTPDIFHVLSATPGARMDYPIESQASYELYRRSKEKAEQRQKRWEEKQKLELIKNKRNKTDAEKKEIDLAYRRECHHRLRGARVKYAVWPMIKRYKPENIGKPIRRGRALDEKVIEAGEGQRIVDIGRCVVIYYQGIIYPKEVAYGEVQKLDGIPLLAHVDMVDTITREMKMRSHRKWRLIVGVLLGLLALRSYQQAYQTLRDGLQRNIPFLVGWYEWAKTVNPYVVSVPALFLQYFKLCRRWTAGSLVVFVVGYMAYYGVLGLFGLYKTHMCPFFCPWEYRREL